MLGGTAIGCNKSKRAIFVTRFGLSDRTAIGVQTKQILENFPQHTHLYWSESVLDPRISRSHRIESFLFLIISTLKRNNKISALLPDFDVSWWRDDKPAHNVVSYLASLRDETSSIYLAPLDASDARRMKKIIDILELPFVLHLWDFLDNASDATTRWLIENASRVFCLNDSIMRDVIAIRGEASILPFRRAATKLVAQRSESKEISVAISGDIGSYLGGVRCLITAIQSLRESGLNYNIVYVGSSKKVLRRNGILYHDSISATGFIPSAAQRDQVLSACAIGFMPGPLSSPESDSRSKYSIPSRILDFMALGLPIVGTLHPDSATFSFCRNFGLDEWLFMDDPDRVAQALATLVDFQEWEKSSQKSLAAFSRLIDTYDIAELKSMLV
jgi:glycosyltransferase involved in cell wall biosynthesis